MLRKPVPPACYSPAIQKRVAPPVNGGLGTPKPRQTRKGQPSIPLTGEPAKPERWPKLVKWSIVDGKAVRRWVPGFTMRTPRPEPGWAFEGSPEEAAIKRDLGIAEVENVELEPDDDGAAEAAAAAEAVAAASPCEGHADEVGQRR